MCECQETVEQLVEQVEQLTETVEQLEERDKRKDERIDQLTEKVEQEREAREQERQAREALENKVGENTAEIRRNDARLKQVDPEGVKELRETVEQHDEEMDEIKETAEESVSRSREIAASVNAIQDETENDEPDQKVAGRATSPMDFFVNCQQFHVNQTLTENRARAVQIIRRREEFARQGRYNGGYTFERRDVTEALTAIQGKRPHRQTVNRVWGFMEEMGGNDVTQETVQVGTSRSGSRKEVIRVSPDADERFSEGRYVGLNLLAGANGPDAARSVCSGGVTPVVTGGTA